MKALLLLLLALPAGAAENQTLWKEWYLYSVGGVPQGYFEETMEKRPADHELALTQRWVEKEDGRTETYIGSVAKDDKSLTPVAFFSERKGPESEYKIDGRAKSGELRMTFKPVKPKAEARKKTVAMPAGLILSNFVPTLLARHDPAQGTFHFSAVVEDARDGKFDAREGAAEVLAVTKSIKGTTCRKAVVDFNGTSGEWWFAKDGKLCALEIGASHSKLELSTEPEAKKAL